MAAGVTLWAVHMSARPADRQQNYGYGKFENLSALFETLLLIVTCCWVVYEASRRLFFGMSVDVNPSVWAFLVVILSIIVDFSRTRALSRVAESTKSGARPTPCTSPPTSGRPPWCCSGSPACWPPAVTNSVAGRCR